MIGSRLTVACLFAIVAFSNRDLAAADNDAVLAADLAAVQGLWERDLTDGQGQIVGRATKDVLDRREKITYFDNNGRLLSAHRVTITLRREGGVRLFEYSPIEIIAGEQKGAKASRGGSYVYKIRDGHFFEIFGVRIVEEDEPIDIIVWRKAQPKEA